MLNDRQVEKLCSLIATRTKLESMLDLCPSNYRSLNGFISSYLYEVEEKIEDFEDVR